MDSKNKKKGTVLNQHSALTTFRIREGKYYKIGVEKSIFALLLRAQQDLRKKFKDLFIEKLIEFGVSQDKFDNLLENAFSNKSDFNIDYNKLNIEALTKVANEIMQFKEREILNQTVEPDEIKKLTLDIKEGVLSKVTDNQKQLLLTPQEINEIIAEVKRYCKDLSIKDYLDFKTIDFTTLANSINTNSTLLKKDIKSAAKTVLEFNYINKKNLDIEIVSSLIASVRFTHDKKNNMTWLVYQIPREILELLLMPEVYVPLEGVVVHELTGSYTIRMYGLLKDHLKRGQVELTKDELFNFFSLPKSYGNKTNLVKKFINPTLEEVETVSGISTKYEFIPKNRYNKIKFYPVLKSQVKSGELKVISKENKNISIEDSKIIQEHLLKSKRNIYVSKAWNKRVDNKLKKIFQEDGESFTMYILKTLYTSLKEEIKTTLVQYINGIIKNLSPDDIIEFKRENLEPEILEAEIIEEKKSTNESESDTIDELLYSMFLKMKEEEQELFRKKARDYYLEKTETKIFNSVHDKIFKTMEKSYIIKVLKNN